MKAINSYLEKHGFEALVPKAVLFDMDGVLYDSMPNHAVAWQESMRKFGIEMSEHDAYATEGQRGIDTIRQMVRQQQGRDISEAEAQTMYDEKSRLFHLMDEAPVMPGIKSLMAQIHAEHIGIGVVTGSGQRPLIARLLRDFGDYLDAAHIVTAYDVKVGKPQPDPYLAGLRKAGNLQPFQALVVENAPLGVRAGVAARIFTIAVNTGILPNASLASAGADLIFPSMTALSEAWPTFPFSSLRVSHSDRWELHYNAAMTFMDSRLRRPSKYVAEERQLYNWIKYNKKLAAHGKLSAARSLKFQILQERATELMRINQYAYRIQPGGTLFDAVD